MLRSTHDSSFLAELGIRLIDRWNEKWFFFRKNSLGEEWVRCGIQDSVHETVRQGLLLRIQCSEKCLVDNMDDNGTQKLLLLIRFGSVQCRSISCFVRGLVGFGHCIGMIAHKRRVALPNKMNFRKSSKGVIFNPTKIYIADFGPLYRFFFWTFSDKIAI